MLLKALYRFTFGVFLGTLILVSFSLVYDYMSTCTTFDEIHIFGKLWDTTSINFVQFNYEVPYILDLTSELLDRSFCFLCGNSVSWLVWIRELMTTRPCMDSCHSWKSSKHIICVSFIGQPGIQLSVSRVYSITCQFLLSLPLHTPLRSSSIYKTALISSQFRSSSIWKLHTKCLWEILQEGTKGVRST